MKKILVALTMAGVLAFGFFAIKSAYREMKRNRQIQAEVEALEQEAEKLKKSNQNLKEKITYFETKDFQELEAKRELSFQKPDEKVVIVNPSPSQDEESKSEDIDDDFGSPGMNAPNYLKWYRLFFD